MESYLVQVEAKQTAEELENNQPMIATAPLKSDDMLIVKEKALKIWNDYYEGYEVEAFLIINRHSSDGNLPCTKYSINLETLELTEL